jgi:DNA modification methylase
MNVRLYYEDCIYGIPARIERDSVDAVVTSPPYNCGTRYNICNDRKAWEQYRKFTLAWVRAVKVHWLMRGRCF